MPAKKTQSEGPRQKSSQPSKRRKTPGTKTSQAVTSKTTTRNEEPLETRGSSSIYEPVYTKEINERIAKRAYELHQQRGYTHGFDFEDWLEAEREILS